MLHQVGKDFVNKCISGAGISPQSRAPSGTATISGWSRDSNHRGDPQFEQKHRMPRPELYFEILSSADVTLRLALSAIAQVAGDVPENFMQLTQWQ